MFQEELSNILEEFTQIEEDESTKNTMDVDGAKDIGAEIRNKVLLNTPLTLNLNIENPGPT